MLLDYPNKPNRQAFWFNRTHAELSMARLVRYNRAESKPISLAAFKRTLGGWTIYFIDVLYISTVLASCGYNNFSPFPKAMKLPDDSRRWTVEEVNVIPIGGSAIKVCLVGVIHHTGVPAKADIHGQCGYTLRARMILIVAQGKSESTRD